MKNYLKEMRNSIITLSLLLLACFTACSDDNKEIEAAPELTVSKTELNFPKGGGEADLSVKANVDLSVNSDQTWCQVTAQTSTSATVSKYKVSVSDNTTTDDRTATITLTGGGLTAKVNVVQTAADGLVIGKTVFDDLPGEGTTIEVKLTTNGIPMAKTSASWISEIQPRAAMAEQTRRFEIAANYGAQRTGTITFVLGELEETVTVHQQASKPADIGMESDAKTLASQIKIGWNLGNAMEVPTGETGWGNPATTKQLIDAVKAAGFNAVRIPCAWNNYIEDQETYRISATWMKRVNEVVDYCVANDMYAILNIHWDGGWLENHPTYDAQEEVNQKQAALWTQIANHFIDYDEHLLFAGTNEVHVENVYTDPTEENNAVQQSYNQTFVDAVRATGGNNARRNLIVQTYNTSISNGVKYLKMPQDKVEGRLMVEVHYYDPYDFTLAENGYTNYWGTPYKELGISNWGQEDFLEASFKSIKETFGDAGFPVILGEYGANRRSNLQGNELTRHLESRAYFLKTVTATAKKYGIVPFYWDNGYMGNNTMALFNRTNYTVYDEQALKALMEGAENE